MKQIKFQLKNKMNVILIPSHKSPVVSVQMWVKTGSADEPKGYEGISHFIEHLVFKGTRKYKVGEIAQVVEASGGELNAYTSFDQTVFYVTISKNYADIALDVISEMMGHPLFDPAEVDSEREVVCEEIKMGIDSPGRSSSQMLFDSVYKKHSYGIPVIGYDKNVRSWPTPKIKKYYQSRYVPSNMALIISGDFDSLEMKKKVSELYSQFKPFKLAKLKRKKELVQKKPTFSVRQKEISESYFYLAFPAPNVKHKDIPALDVLAMILGQGESSRLYTKLRLEKAIVNSVSAFNYSPQDPGLFALSARYTDQNPEDIFDEIFSEIEKIKNDGVMWEEIKKSIINISSEQFYSIETVDGIANKIGSSQFYLNDTKAHEKYLSKIQKITPADIQKMAKKYLALDKANYSLMSPKKTTETKNILKMAEKSWKHALVKSKVAQQSKNQIKNKKIKIPKIIFKSMSASKTKPYTQFTTKNGTNVLFQQSSDIPTVSAKIIFGGGSRLESREKMGLSDMLGRTLVTQTKTKSENEILKSIEELGAGISAFSGKNTNGFSIDYMQAFESEVLDLSDECINSPEFSSEILEREKSAVKKQILSKQDQPSYLCGKQFVQAMFPNHPISFDQMGTDETITQLTTTELFQLYNKAKARENMQVTVVGDFSEKKWTHLIDKIENTLVHSGKQLKALKFEKLEKNQTLFLKKDKEQSHVIIGWQGLSLSHQDRFILQAIQAVMAGQGGRLFYELRDKNSLAYSVSPIKMESLETGYFGGYIACSPDKIDKAIKMFIEEFNKISTKIISDEELDRAKKYLIGQHDIGLQRKSSICNLLAFDRFYGNDLEQTLNVAPVYQQITQQDVLRVSNQLFSKPYIVSVVGKTAPEGL